jgi:hypothetical protein
MKTSEWVKAIEAEADEGGDLISLGAQAGEDAELSKSDGGPLLQALAHTIFGSEFGNFLEGFLQHRECPEIDFWVDLILEAKDSELGGSVLSSVAPFLDLTALVSRLLGKSSTANAGQKQRIALTVWAAACVETRYLSPPDQFSMKEHLQAVPLASAIRENLKHFVTEFDRNSLKKALASLGG